MDKNIAPQEDKLEEQLHRVQRELSVLYNINMAMRTTLELNHILYIILTGVTAHTGLGFNRALLFLVNKNTRDLEAKMAIGPESGEDADHIWKHIRQSNQGLGDLIRKDNIAHTSTTSTLYKSIRHLKIPLDPQTNSILTTAYHKSIPLRFKKEDLAPYPNDPLLKVFHTQEFVVVPLKAKDFVNGLIIADNIYTKKPITDEDLRIFAMLANEAGLAIENSQLFEIVLQKSNRDSLTSLWNHGYFQDALIIELKKAKNKGWPLSLLMIDIDNFKKLNDTYGHRNGDSVIREVAGVLKNSSRDIDYVCRYGGEEFSIILTQTDKEQALAIAERMRENVMNHAFKEFKPNEDIQVTVSIGLAAFPFDTESAENIIEKSDQMMYVAKMSGKNQTCVYGRNY